MTDLTQAEFLAILEKHQFCRNAAIKELKISRQTFYNWVKKYEITLAPVVAKKHPRTPRPKTSIPDKALLIDEAEKALFENAAETFTSIAQIAKHLRLSPRTVTSKLLKHSIEWSAKRGKPEAPLPKHLADRIQKHWVTLDDAIADYF